MGTPPQREPPEIRFGNFTLQPGHRLLLEHAQPVRIGSRALDILIALLRAPGQVISKQALMEQVWPGRVTDEGSLRVQMALLRKALGDGQQGRRYIQNVPQRGYCFVEQVSSDAAASPASADEADGPAAAAVLPTAAPPLAAPPPAGRWAPSLPATPRHLIGREELLASIVEQMPHRRFVTLVGPGGIGKTTLAVAVAQRLAARDGAGLHFVDLAPLTDPLLVASALAAELGVPALSGDPVPQLLAFLGTQRRLVVLDNCEQVIDAAASLAERLLHGAPGLQLLATSREPLRADGEWVHRIAALELPDGDAPLTPAEALACPAVELLVERAAASIDGFVLAPHDVPFAVQLCRRLDGIPLAIELVATRIASFGLRGLAERMDDRLALSVHGRRTALPRHQTLHATLDWSYSLLGEIEQRVLCRLSVFRERFTLPSALAIASDIAALPTVDEALAFESIAGLVAKSLVATEGRAGEMSYRLLETTRAYAADKLAHSGERERLQRRHALHMSELLAASEDELRTLPAAQWRALHGRRIDDVRHALAWAFGGEGGSAAPGESRGAAGPDDIADPADSGDPGLGASLTAASAPIWFHLGLVAEYLERLRLASRASERLAPDPLRDMRLALALGHAHQHLSGAGRESEAALSTSRQLAERLGRPHDELRALWGLFTEQMMRSDYAGARRLAEAFGRVDGVAGDRQASAAHHRLMALALHMLGEQAEARRHAEAALQPPAVNVQFLHGSAYQVDHQASAMTPLARIAWLQGRPAEAARLAELAVSRAIALDHGFSITYALALAALPISLWSGDLEAAQRHVRSLRECTLRHSLQFWHTWCSMYERVIAWRLHPKPLDTAWLEAAASHPGRADMLATLDAQLLSNSAAERVAQQRNAWCAAEVMRIDAEAAWRAGRADADETHTRLHAALHLAREQGALAWELRVAMAIARVCIATARAAEAGAVLGDVVARFDATEVSADLLCARAMVAASAG